MTWYRVVYDSASGPVDSGLYTQIDDLDRHRTSYNRFFSFVPVSAEEVIVQCDLLQAAYRGHFSWFKG